MKEFQGLYEIIRTLRGENGCPWDKEQTIQSMAPNIVEETYELIEAIDHDNTEDLKEELGDLMFLTVFVAYLAEQEGRFRVAEAVQTIADKLVRRHPHVFGEIEVEGVDHVLRNWEAIKLNEKKNAHRKSPFDGIPRSLPEIQRFAKVLQKIERQNVDLTQHYHPAPQESLEAFREQPSGDTTRRLLKDILYLCYLHDIDATQAVRQATEEMMQSLPPIAPENGSTKE